MDKYEYKIRSDEISALIADGRYADAVKLADTIDWRNVGSVKKLCMISDLYKINRRYEESRDILIMAYEKNPNSRAIVYSLCELAIKMGEFVQAVEYYKEFVRIAPRDDKRYILQYRLYEAQDVSIEERIAVLQEYKKHDFQEKWGYELAYLYHRVGLETECVEICDEMFLWFGEGRYVMKALELKSLHTPLSREQQDRYNRYKGMTSSMPAGASVPFVAPAPAPVAVPAQEIAQVLMQNPVMQDAPVPAVSYVSNFANPAPMQPLMQSVSVEPEGGDGQMYPQGLTFDLKQPEADNNMWQGDWQQAVTQPVDPWQQAPAQMAGDWQMMSQQMPQGMPITDTGRISEMSNDAAKALIQSVIMPGSSEVAYDYGQGAVAGSYASAGEVWREEVPGVQPATPYYVPSDIMTEPTREMPPIGQSHEEQIAPVMQEEITAAGPDDGASVMPDLRPEEYDREEEEAALMSAAEVPSDPEDFFSSEAGFRVPTPDVSNFNTLNLQKELAEGLKEVMDGDFDAQETQGSVTKQIFFSDTGNDISPKENYVAFSPEEPPSTEEEPIVVKPELKNAHQSSPEAVSKEVPSSSIAEEFKDKQVAASIAASTVEQNALYKGTVYTDEPLQDEVPGAVIRPNLRYQANHFDRMLTQDYDGQLSMAFRDEQRVEKQITGQISISDYMQEWERVKKKQQEKQLETIRNRVMADTGDMFAAYDEETRKELELARFGRTLDSVVTDDGSEAEFEVEDILDESSQVSGSAAEEEKQDIVSEKASDLTESEDAGALADMEPGDPVVKFDTSELETKVIEAQIARQEGEEAAIENHTEPGEDVFDQSMQALQTVIEPEESADEYEEEADTVSESDTLMETADPDEAAALKEETDPDEAAALMETADADEAGILKESVDPDDAGDLRETADETGIEEREFESAVESQETADAEENKQTTADSEKAETTRSDSAARDESLTAETEETPSKSRRSRKTSGTEKSEVRPMTPEEKEIFSQYIHQKEAREQIVRAIDSISMAAYTDNVIITGEDGAGTVPLARGLIKVAEQSDSNFSGKVARVPASALNRKSISPILDKVEGGALIIQQAGDLKEETAKSLLKLLENENKGIIVVLEDTKSEIEGLIKRHPGLTRCFTVRVDIEALDDDSLVAYAKQYALENEYSIDNMGILALHTRIADRQTSTHEVTVSEVREIIDSAIGYANKHTVGHFFDVLLGKRYDKEDMIILREKDFMHA